MKFTSAQTALLHAAESLGVSALASVVTALYQYFILHGFNVQGLIGVACVTFLGAFSMLYKSLQNNPNLAPALLDTVKELKDTADQHTQAISFLQSAMQAAVQVPVTPITPAPQVNPVNLNTGVTTNAAPQLQFVPMNRSFTNLEIPAVAPVSPTQ
jgi:hypothetical protein